MANHELLDRVEAALYLGPETPADPCLLVIFGGSGDLTRRLLVPALYNLACDGQLSERFAVIGVAMDELTTESFRVRMNEGIEQFKTRDALDKKVFDRLVERFHYVSGRFDDPKTYAEMGRLVEELHGRHQTAGNVLFYLAVPPSLFAPVSRQLHDSGVPAQQRGWTRLVVEKPFGRDLASAAELNRNLLQDWREDQGTLQELGLG